MIHKYYKIPCIAGIITEKEGVPPPFQIEKQNELPG